MKKGFRETMLQLVLSPLTVCVSDNYQVTGKRAVPEARVRCDAVCEPLRMDPVAL